MTGARATDQLGGGLVMVPGPRDGGIGAGLWLGSVFAADSQGDCVPAPWECHEAQAPRPRAHVARSRNGDSATPGQQGQAPSPPVPLVHIQGHRCFLASSGDRCWPAFCQGPTWYILGLSRIRGGPGPNAQGASQIPTLTPAAGDWRRPSVLRRFPLKPLWMFFQGHRSAAGPCWCRGRAGEGEAAGHSQAHGQVLGCVPPPLWLREPPLPTQL